MSILADKKVIIIGDCAESAGATVVFSSTECFV